MPVVAFHQAIQGLLTPDSPFKAAIGGRFRYVDEIPSEFPLPYAAWFTVYSEERDTYTEYIDERMIQISVFASSLSECISISDKADALFNGALAMANGIYPMRLVRGAKVGPTKEDDGSRHMILEYVARVEKI